MCDIVCAFVTVCVSVPACMYVCACLSVVRVCGVCAHCANLDYVMPEQKGVWPAR